MSREEFLKAMNNGYRDRFGYPVSRRGQLDPAGNCLMFLAEEMIILYDLGPVRPDDLWRFGELLNACTLEPGNLRRTPFKCTYSTDQEGWDDFLGTTAAASIVEGDWPHSVATKIILFGRKHFFRWGPFRMPYAYVTSSQAPEETRDVKAFLGRYVHLIAHFRRCAGETPNPLQRLWWCWSVAFAGWGDPDGQDPWRLTYLLVRAWATRKRWWHPENMAVKIWRWRFFERWPRGIQDVRVMYFNDENHPLAKFASMEF